jgi:hypothetical protein
LSLSRNEVEKTADSVSPGTGLSLPKIRREPSNATAEVSQ